MSRSLTAQGVIGLLGILAGLCTVFAFVVSVTDGWREHAQETWPQATAIVEGCSVDPYIPLRSASHTPVWHIRCRIGYRAGADQIQTNIRSRSAASGWGGDTEGMRQWVAHHPLGTSIVVHYDPTAPKTAVLTETDMPYAGPRTHNNLRLLLISSVAWVSLLIVARRLRLEPRL